ncbi:MAG TPA: HIT domain-containing protein [Actinomycetota bacterium]|nr:HIT domain-containing protein [Actinomycetota bacterium]
MTSIGSPAQPESGGCFLCDALATDEDEKLLIVHRGDSAFVIMNAFPYNTGHLMIAPNRHVDGLSKLDAAERADLMELTSQAIDVIKEAINPEGFNTGMNLGRIAGAGVPGHLHMHVVPRWGGDTNFMPIVGNTKVLPELLEETAAKIRPGFT